MGMIEELKKRIDEVDVVSFDIFDTLIVRLYRKPTDLFAHLEESTGFSGFKQARVLAEQEARNDALKKDVHEITLDEIYEYIHPSYRDLAEKEIEMECLMCKANPEMLEIFHYAIARKKRVFISSDMYLPKEVIERILNNNGYLGYEKLLLSSSTLRPKATGEMYEDLITQSGVDPCRILHIGDNRISDFEMALKAELNAFRYEPISDTYGNNLNSAYFALLNKQADSSVAASILKGMVTLRNAQCPNQGYWEHFAYQYAGLLMVGYCQWLKQQFDREGIKKAYFMLRDGYIVKRIFNFLYPDFETYEIYGSRRMFLFARMNQYEDVQEYFTSLIEGVTYQGLFNRLVIDSPELYEAYCKRFPNQDDMISEVGEIHRFMKDHEAQLLRVGEEENELIAEYLNTIRFSAGKCAVVDLGWRCSMLKGLQAVCEKSRISYDAYGYYLGTHPFHGKGLRVASFALNNGKPDNPTSIIASMNSLYVIDILELIFSAPHSSIMKLRRENNQLIPVFQTTTPHELERQNISKIILKSILNFANEYQEATNKFPVFISPEVAILSAYYLKKSASRLDREMLGRVFVFPGIGDDSVCFPLTPNGRGRIGLINPWPNVQGAESEALTRIKYAMNHMGLDAVIVECNGYRLDDYQKPTGIKYKGSDFDFVISFNYETPKLLDCFYYYTLWSPPEMALRLEDYAGRLSNNLMMNDDYLSYWHGNMESHIKSICWGGCREINLNGASSLVASFDRSLMLKPNLNEPVMFYCGMNWEKVDGEAIRHNELFKLLDATGKVKFFGPEKVNGWGNIKPWDGYKCYMGSLPFDGSSLLKELNRCGICLVLSSDIHRRSGAATNRTYEACAAGAVMISDDNPFMLHYFKDAALFINYNKNDPQDTFRQIMEKYEWIISHKEEACILAECAQKIFAKEFAVDVQVRNVLLNHSNRFKQMQKNYFPDSDNEKVLVTYVLNTTYIPHVENYLDKVFENIQNQSYRNIELAIAADFSIANYVMKYCSIRCANATVIPMPLYDKSFSKTLTDGEAIRKLQQEVWHTYWINTTARETWFYDHVSTLVRAIEPEEVYGVYSGSLLEDTAQVRNTSFFGVARREHFFDKMAGSFYFPAPGQFMFKASAHKMLPNYLFECVDGKEHYAYANILHYLYQKKLVFTRRMTFAYICDGCDSRALVLSDDKQTRFIQDLVRFNIPGSMGGASSSSIPASVLPASPAIPSPSPLALHRMFITFPIKIFLKLRYYQFRLRRLKPESRRYESIEQKFQHLMSEYDHFWGI